VVGGARFSRKAPFYLRSRNFPRVTRRIAIAATVLVLVGSAAGCSSSRTSAQPGSETTLGPGARITMTRAHVEGVVARHLPRLRSVLADERRNCGGAAAVEPANVTSARQCAKSLRLFSTSAQDFVSVLVLLRPPEDLTTLVADTIDAARPVAVVLRAYPIADCLPLPSPGTLVRARCDTSGREFAMLIAQFEKVLEGWRA
jgi:hypothetical protein